MNGYITHINDRCLTNTYDSAVKAMEAALNEDMFKSAAHTFKSISGFKDADDLAGKCLEKAEICRKDSIYENAEKKQRNDYFNEAMKLYESISGWKDADVQAAACKKKIAQQKEMWKKKIKIIVSILAAVVIIIVLFVKLALPKIEYNSALNKAMGLIDSGDYDAGYAILEELGETETIESNKYDRAIKLIDSGDYRAAYVLLSGLAYKDSAEKLQNIKSLLLANANPGETVFFGSYEQDNDTSNGKEDITWIVLAKEDNKILVISEEALDCKPYNNEKYTEVTWETCALRKWLNSSFINSAFSSEEKAKIPAVTVSADKNPKYSTDPGNATQDQIFLLSIAEAEKYFSSDSARRCTPTEYAIANGAERSCLWWLRSPGKYSERATNVESWGGIYCEGYLYRTISAYDGDLAVRPAMWISLE